MNKLNVITIVIENMLQYNSIKSEGIPFKKTLGTIEQNASIEVLKYTSP